jgi:hypothetical protein
MQLKTFSIIPVFFALSYLGECGFYNEPEPTPETILGQWQEIARGNNTYPELEPDGHVIEFLPDGTYHAFFSNGAVATRSYQIDDKFVYYGSGKSPDGHTYRYRFIGTDMLRMDYVDGVLEESMLTPTFHIYKRVKNE